MNGLSALLWLQVLLRGAWVHRGDGSLPFQGDVLIQGDSIAAVGAVLPALPGYTVIEARGQHLYPALIGLNTPIGLVEIEAVRATRDAAEVGSFTPEVTAYTAFNVDSRVLPTLRENGLLYVESTPQGGWIAGQSSMLRLRGRTREEALVLEKASLHLYPPSLRPWVYASYEEQRKALEEARKGWEKIEAYFAEAARWCGGDSSEQNLRYRALCPYLRGEKPVTWHVDAAEDIRAAVALSQKWHLRAAIAGGAEALAVAGLLRQAQVPVILSRTHRLPPSEDAPLSYSYTLPKALRDSGVTVMLGHESFWNQRNVPYNAGTAAAWGLSREEALSLLTDVPARWLGLSRLGRIAPGYKASLLLVEKDLLDMPSSRLLRAWIEGQEVNLSDNPQRQLFEKYR
ncbi:MAG: amidohydrolase [Bacteroidia bacterium]|nr:MAG: amidohydrolase [Bacteroidia bacterium]